jgi:hypothetical protein
MYASYPHGHDLSDASVRQVRQHLKTAIVILIQAEMLGFPDFQKQHCYQLLLTTAIMNQSSTQLNPNDMLKQGAHDKNY